MITFIPTKQHKKEQHKNSNIQPSLYIKQVVHHAKYANMPNHHQSGMVHGAMAYETCDGSAVRYAAVAGT